MRPEMAQLALTAALLLPLALDTFALATALGVAGLEPHERLRVTLVFTLFEAVMPIAGLLAGRLAGSIVGPWADFAGIAVIAALGIYLVARREEDDGDETNVRLLARAHGVAVLGLGLSISIDELAVGLGAGLIGLPLGIAVAWIAIQAFVATQLGLRLGGRIGEAFLERSEKAAGLALIAVATILLALRLLGFGL